MPLSFIPEKTEDSLGIVKVDVLPYTDPATQVPAVQFERLKDAVIANAQTIGVGDGTTPNSLTKRVATLETAPANVGIKFRLISPEAVVVPPVPSDTSAAPEE